MRKNSIIFVAVVTFITIAYLCYLSFQSVMTPKTGENKTVGAEVLSQTLSESCLESLGIVQYRYIYNSEQKSFVIIKYDENFNLHPQLTPEDKAVLLNWLVNQ
jgi:hypothetical protein